MNLQARNALTALMALATLEGTPTAEDRTALGLWAGWGPVAPALALVPEGEWVAVADTLHELVSEDDIRSARDVVDTSFFTPPVVVDAVFELLAKTGFTGGRVLEPGCGSGNFMGHHAGMGVAWTGVEIDPVSARIAQALHPDATIVNQPMEKMSLPSRSFDAVVGNFPFSDSRVFDPSFDSAPLHEYFTARALDAVKPGGHVVAVVSRHMLDSGSTILERADLVAAVRLPAGVFAGTQVVADILVLRRRVHPDAPAGGWVEPAELTEYNGWAGTRHQKRVRKMLDVVTGTHTASVSGLWDLFPDCVAGVHVATGYYQSPVSVRSEDRENDIRRATAAAARHITPVAQVPAEGTPFTDIVLEDADGRKERSYHLSGDGVAQVVDGVLTPVRGGAELKALLPLRDAAVTLIDLESNPDRPDAEIAGHRARTLDLYNEYAAKYGALNRGLMVAGKPDADTGEPTFSWRRPTMGGFRKDPDSVAVFALEAFDMDTGAAEPAPILLRRVGAHPPQATSASSPEEALALTLGEAGRVDTTRIAALLNIPLEDTAATLGDLVFVDPTTGDLVTQRDYLSGDVRTKLSAAVTAASNNPAFSRNVTGLQEVQPAPLTELDIRVQLGVTWVPPADVELFLAQVFGSKPRVHFTAATASWEIEGNHHRATADAHLAYGTPDMDPFQLAAAALNSREPTVHDEVWDGFTSKRVKNVTKTLAAVEKMRDIQDRFSLWVWEDKTRAERLVTEYNTRFNSHVIRRNDGSYLTFPGLDESVNLWSWQRDAVDRIISSERTMIGHPVGSGKTKSFITAAMTLRRMGLARKPLIAVPLHLLEQVSREAQQAYPTGKFLVATKEDLTKENRRLFAARCATGDWDAVFMTHQAFTSIPVDPEVEEAWLEEQKAELRWHLQNPESAGRRGAKQVATAVRRLEERILSLRHNTSDENAFTFEQLGVDHISVDEFHFFRRLSLTTRAQGFSLGSSKRATDLLLKIETLARRRPGKPVFAGFTGTPWSNTLAETFVWQKMLQPDRLVEAGVEHFDAWAATFVRYETKVEVAPDGSGFRMHTRPSAMQNVPELRLMFGEVADLLTADAIGLERPDATWETLVAEPSPQQLDYVRDLADRADGIRNGNPQPLSGDRVDNMLLVCGDGRRVALDPRLVGIYEPSSKVMLAADRIVEHYHAGADTAFGRSAKLGGMQLVMCDIGTPRPDDAQVYGRLRAELVRRGVPAGRIRFIHEATTDKARAHLFAQCREGAVSVLMGSTDKVGVGTNIQTRLQVVHHLDAPWRPSDIEQREGRALRPGNLSSSVKIYRYVTEQSFDAYMYQTLQRKQQFISQMFVVDGTVREIEDVSDAVMTFAEVKAIAAGNPELLREAELTNEVRRLRVMRSVWSQNINQLRSEAAADRESAKALRLTAERVTEAMEALAPYQTTGTNLTGLAENIQAGRGGPRHRWKAVDLALAGSGYYAAAIVGDRVVEISYRYRVVGSLKFTAREARMATPKLVALLVERVSEWAAAAVDEPARLNELAGVREIRATSAARVASETVFEHDGALAVAERELAVVQSAIAESATNHRQAVAAA